MLVDAAYIGTRLRKARLAKKLSQIELAQKMGVRQGTISRAESGHDLRVGTLLEIARALDLDVVLAPRRLRAIIDNIVDGGTSQATSVYTGGGDEPYFEGEAPRDFPRTLRNSGEHGPPSEASAPVGRRPKP